MFSEQWRRGEQVEERAQCMKESAEPPMEGSVCRSMRAKCKKTQNTCPSTGFTSQV